jgi:hypothetical protein
MSGSKHGDLSDLEPILVDNVADIASRYAHVIFIDVLLVTEGLADRSPRALNVATSSQSFASGLSTPSSANDTPSTSRPRRPHEDERARNESTEHVGGHSVAEQGQKEDGPPDWYIEGPGRRVGYDNLTAIDWIYEYTKERHRLRKLLADSRGLVGHLRQIFDASQVWVVLVASGISVGCLAALINIASDWLGDIKTGYCKKGAGGGQFYLNKQFCCWGHDEFAQCQDWTPWPSALGVRSAGGQFVISYIFFIFFAVWNGRPSPMQEAVVDMGTRFSLRSRLQFWSSIILSTRATVAFPRSRRFWEDL